MFDPDAHLPRPNKTLIYLGACVIAGLRLARERQVNVRVIPTGNAIEESIDLSHEIFNRVFRKVPRRLDEK
jgi:MinD-like ATPase involved in chromosome partitioning or flagellar assembly